MSTPDDDLHGWQAVFLLVFFGAAGGGLYLVGWLTRPSFLYDNPLVCAAIAGGACFPARFLAERFAWWNRLEQRRQARRDRLLKRALADARRRARTVSCLLRVRFAAPGFDKTETRLRISVGGRKLFSQPDTPGV